MKWFCWHNWTKWSKVQLMKDGQPYQTRFCTKCNKVDLELL